MLIPAHADHRFCERYQAWRKHLDVAMWQVEPAVADYLPCAARWVRLMPHRHMLHAIRQAYPDMAGSSAAMDQSAENSTRKANPFLRGMARAFDLSGTMFRSPDHGVGRGSDGDAIRDGWRAVGDSVEDAMIGLLPG